MQGAEGAEVIPFERSALDWLLGNDVDPEVLVVGDDYLTDAPFDENEIEPWACDEGYAEWNCAMTDEEIMRLVWLERMELAGIVQLVPPAAPIPQGPYVKKPIPAQLRWAVFRRDGYRCVKCGCDEDLTADHIQAEVHGGKASISNLQTLCRPCNSRKGAR